MRAIALAILLAGEGIEVILMKISKYEEDDTQKYIRNLFNIILFLLFVFCIVTGY